VLHGKTWSGKYCSGAKNEVGEGDFRRGYIEGT
jgi:hypothetical protein